MTRILALDTATSACSVAINMDGKVVEDFVVAPQDHTRRLLPMVDSLLTKHHLSLQDLDAIAFTEGPGSFTGLRICVGVVQGLAFGADLPVVGVSSLLTMVMAARRLLQLDPGSLVLPALDARMDEAYWGLYRLGDSKQLPECLISDRASSPADLLLQLNAQEPREPIYMLGSACPLLPNEAAGELSLVCNPDFYPHAEDAARIAEVYLGQGKAKSALDAQPAYVRNEVSWAKRQRIRSE